MDNFPRFQAISGAKSHKKSAKEGDDAKVNDVDMYKVCFLVSTRYGFGV